MSARRGGASGEPNRDPSRLYEWSSFDPDEMHALGALARSIGFKDDRRATVIIKRDLSDVRLVAAAEWLLKHQRFPLQKEPHHALVCRALTVTDGESATDDQEALMRIAERRRAEARSQLRASSGNQPAAR
jgi:hypothetical protein